MKISEVMALLDEVREGYGDDVEIQLEVGRGADILESVQDFYLTPALGNTEDGRRIFEFSEIPF